MRATGRPSPTSTGRAAIAASLALGVLGAAFGYVSITVVAAGIAVAVITGWFAALTVPNLEVERVIEPTRVERGRSAVGLVSVTNPSRHRSRACTALEVVAGDEVGVNVPALAPRRSVAVSYPVPTHRRGALAVGPLSISRRDPFGLWVARRPVGATMTLLVQPRIHPLDPRPAGRARHLDGPLSDTAPRGTHTFHSLREYTPGDDVRRVHWRSSARTGTLMVREHVDTSLPSTVVVLDTRSSAYTDDRFEDAVDVASSVVASSQARGFPVRLVTTGGDVTIVRAGQRGQELRDFLTTVSSSADERVTMQRAATEVVRGRDHDSIIVVSGAVDVADLAAVTAMSRRFATASLVTIRDTGSSPVWPSGVHLDGPTAELALRRWQSTATARPATGISA